MPGILSLPAHWLNAGLSPFHLCGAEPKRVSAPSVWIRDVDSRQQHHKVSTSKHQETNRSQASRCGEALFLHIDHQSGRASRDSSLLLRRSPRGKHAARNTECVHVHEPTYTINMGDDTEECLREGRLQHKH